MAVERKAPDAILAAVALSGAVSSIQDDPDSPDLGWLIYDAVTNSNSSVRVSFPTPSGNLNAGAGLQEFRLLVRKNLTGGNATTVNVVLYENGVAVATLLSGVSVTSLTGQVLSATWDASVLAGAAGANVEVAMEQAAGGNSGSGINRRRIEVGAIEWNADYSTAESHSGTAVLAGGGQLAPAHSTQRSVVVTASAGGSAVVAESTQRGAAPAVSAGGELSAAAATARSAAAALAVGGAVAASAATARPASAVLVAGVGLLGLLTGSARAAQAILYGGGAIAAAGGRTGRSPHLRLRSISLQSRAGNVRVRSIGGAVTYRGPGA